MKNKNKKMKKMGSVIWCTRQITKYVLDLKMCVDMSGYL